MSGDRQIESHQGTEKNEPGSPLIHEVASLQLTTDLAGRPCQYQPGQNEFPVLDSGLSQGCLYQNVDASQTEQQDGLTQFNTSALYERGKSETVHVNFTVTNGIRDFPGSGTGVIIGQLGNKLLIATDNHVVYPSVANMGLTVSDRSITMPDGTTHKTMVELNDPAHDTAVLSIDSRSVSPGSYHVASIEDTPPNSGSGVILGFPVKSRSIYASPASFAGQAKSDQIYDKSDLLPGEDPELSLLVMYAHSEKGESGSPAYDSSGKVAGLVEGGPTEGPDVGQVSYVSPLTRNEVDQWLKKLQNKS